MSLQTKYCIVAVPICKGATRGGAKGAEAPPLAKLKLRKKIKYRIVLIFFVSHEVKLRELANLWP